MSTLEVDGRLVRITSPDRVLYPRTGFTKADLLGYHAEIAPAIVPHLADRPTSLRRFPQGVEGSTWYQTRCGANRPPWMRSVVLTVPGGEPQDYCVIDDAPGLLWAANLSAIELHPLLLRAPEPEVPTAVVFDLDPGEGVDLLACCHVAVLLGRAIGRLGLRSYVKTSGSRGLHVVVPLNTPCTFERTKAFARETASSLAVLEPELVTDRQAKHERRGRVLVDWLQNDHRRSTVAPYSLRAGEVPTVSMPLRWTQVRTALRRGSDEDLWFGPRSAVRAVRADGDPMAETQTLRQHLPA